MTKCNNNNLHFIVDILLWIFIMSIIYGVIRIIFANFFWEDWERMFTTQRHRDDQSKATGSTKFRNGSYFCNFMEEFNKMWEKNRLLEKMLTTIIHNCITVIVLYTESHCKLLLYFNCTQHHLYYSISYRNEPAWRRITNIRRVTSIKNIISTYILTLERMVI